MNDNFNYIVNQSHISLYEVAHMSGVPYTTVNKLAKGTLNINKCSAETVSRLATYLDVPIEELLNPYHVMDGVSGKYNKIKYSWKLNSNKKMELSFRYQGEDMHIEADGQYTLPKHRKAYDGAAPMYIETCISDREFRNKATLLKG